MQAVCYNLPINQNASFRMLITIRDPDSNPLDLTGYSGEFVIRKSVQSPDAILRATSTDGAVIFGDSDFNIEVVLTATQTDELPTNNREIDIWVYELLIWDPQNKEDTSIRVAYGRTLISPSAARPDNT